MHVPYLDLKAQFESVRPEISAAVDEVLSSCAYILGPAVERFESNFARFCGATHSVAVGSGTDALHLALLAHGVGPGDEVITQANTFMATVEAILYTGATPIFVDVVAPEYTIDLAAVRAAVTPRTKAFVPVHLFGQPADISAVELLGKELGLAIVHDASQAHGAAYGGVTLGSVSTACYSFYPGKNLGAYGEGGALTTNDSTILEMSRKLRNHGSTVRYRHDVLGYNYRMDGIQGAILDVKLKRLHEWTEGRRRVAAQYDRLLQGVARPAVPSKAHHVYHIYPVFVENRNSVAAFLRERGVETNVHYPIPCHLQPLFNGAYKEGTFPESERIAQTELSLPIYPEMTDDMVAFVSETLHTATNTLVTTG